MNKILYFLQGNFEVSETFIIDLLSGLDKCQESYIKVVSGASKPKAKCIGKIEVIGSGFHNIPLNISWKFFKIGQLFNRGYRLKMWVDKHIANQCIKRIIRKEKPDIAYIDYGTAAVKLYNTLERNQIPFIVHMHGYDYSHEIKNSVYLEELKKVFNKAQQIIVPSNFAKRRLILLGCQEKKIEVVRYGVPFQIIRPIEWSERIKLNPKIVFLGRLTPKKDPIALIHAFNIVNKSVPNATLDIIGDGELMLDVKKEISKLGLKNSIKLYGALDREACFKILRNAWVYAQHSVTSFSGDQEGFPISIAEAAAHEIPIVSTRHNGIPENVIDGITGLLVDEYNYEEMAEKIIYLIKNPEIAKEMGINGRKHIQQICNMNERINSINNLLLA